MILYPHREETKSAYPEKGVFMNIVESEIKREGHQYKIAINDIGELLYSVDGGEEKFARTFRDGKLIFNGAQEILVNGQYSKVEGFELPEEEYNRLSSIQAQILKDSELAQSMERFRRGNTDVLKQVDKWKHKIRSYKKAKAKIRYVIHDFTIGAQTYRFYERNLQSEVSPDGILINPAYKVTVTNDMTETGAVPVQLGELIFWRYFFEGRGWETIRELTLNELLCVEIIKLHGMVATGKL